MRRPKGDPLRGFSLGTTAGSLTALYAHLLCPTSNKNVDSIKGGEKFHLCALVSATQPLGPRSIRFTMLEQMSVAKLDTGAGAEP
eukprot:4796884-Amphidinium_carterae.1